MPRRIIQRRGAETTQTVNGLWETATKNDIEKATMRCTFGQLCGSNEAIIKNVTSNMNASRRLEKIKKQTSWILEIANKVRNIKIANLEASLNEEEGVELQPSPPVEANEEIISIGSSPDAVSSPINSAGSPPIPGFEPSEPSSQSTLASLPSRQMSSPGSSYNNPMEAAELFGFEPQEAFIIPPGPILQPQEQIHRQIDENDAMDALDNADANIGVGIEDRMLAELDFDEILAHFYE